MSYGFETSRHLMKVKPFIERLNAAKNQLLAAIQSGNQKEVIRGIEDVGFWTGRSIAELISASEAGLENPSLFRQGFASLYSAQEVLMFGKKYMMGEKVSPPPSSYGAVSAPMSWEWAKHHKKPIALAAGLVGGPLIFGIAKTAVMQGCGALITLGSFYFMTQPHDYQDPA